MIRLLIWALLFYIGYRLIISLTVKKKDILPSSTRNRADAAITHRDPICGIYISEEDAIVGRVGDQRHYFCSTACLEKYREQFDQQQP